MSSPSTFERTERTRMTSRIRDHFDRLILALAHDGEPDPGVCRSAHLLYRLVQSHALHPFIVDLDDEVVGQNTGLRGGRFVDRRRPP